MSSLGTDSDSEEIVDTDIRWIDERFEDVYDIGRPLDEDSKVYTCNHREQNRPNLVKINYFKDMDEN
jgi:hypothetical protein